MKLSILEERDIRQATDDNITLYAIKSLNAVGERAAVDRRIVRDSVTGSYQISVRRVYQSLIRLRLQGIIGFTSCKTSTHGYAVYMYRSPRCYI